MVQAQNESGSWMNCASQSGLPQRWTLYNLCVKSDAATDHLAGADFGRPSRILSAPCERNIRPGNSPRPK